MPDSRVDFCLECILQILFSFSCRQIGLLPGIFQPTATVCKQTHIHLACNYTGYFGCLIESAFTVSAIVQRDRQDTVRFVPRTVISCLQCFYQQLTQQAGISQFLVIFQGLNKIPDFARIEIGCPDTVKGRRLFLAAATRGGSLLPAGTWGGAYRATCMVLRQGLKAGLAQVKIVKPWISAQQTRFRKQRLLYNIQPVVCHYI